ncbi:hypothetical protein TanjilG_18624 [Lupinus angustifolius]|uniref:Secreted protein n=1 Tax=Lupinus angustifolius TaxID=3871 RepID=A0A1J7IEA2_LUPAN|nr:hypothetical protein TanjilG_18624 [Lupinus angustifolius]
MARCRLVLWFGVVWHIGLIGCVEASSVARFTWKDVVLGDAFSGTTRARRGHGGLSLEPVGGRWTTRAALAARAGCRVLIGGQIGNWPFGVSSLGVE